MSAKPCNGCIGCCLTLAVRELNMPSFHACRYLAAPPAYPTGCTVYDMRPTSCALWRCRWQLTEGWPEELRPDRCGVVFETVSEMVKVNGCEIPVVEAYVIPGQDEEAFNNNPAVRRAIAEICLGGFAVLWRMRGPGGPSRTERVRVILFTGEGFTVGPITDTTEPPVPYEDYSAIGNRLARRDQAEAMARERSRK